jgi:hypothetical protein
MKQSTPSHFAAVACFLNGPLRRFPHQGDSGLPATVGNISYLPLIKMK